MRRGEVWWYERPDEKRRPVLILTRSEAIEHLNRVIAASISTRVREIPTEVELDETDGMPRSCAVGLDNTFAARKGLLTERVTVLGPERMDAVCRALALASGC